MCYVDVVKAGFYFYDIFYWKFICFDQYHVAETFIYRWAHLHVESNGNFSDELQAYGSGWLEGQATRELINMHWQNTLKNFCSVPLSTFCSKLQDYVKKNTDWIRLNIEAHPDDPYWHQVCDIVTKRLVCFFLFAECAL